MEIEQSKFNNIISIPNYRVNYGQEIEIETSNRIISNIYFELEDGDKGIISIENNKIIGLSNSGSQNVFAFVKNEKDEIISQTKFNVINEVDQSGKKTALIENIEHLFGYEKDVTFELNGTTNSDSKLQYRIVEGNEFGALDENKLTVYEANASLFLEAFTEETEEFTSAKYLFSVIVQPYKLGVPYKEYLFLEEVYNEIIAFESKRFNHYNKWFKGEDVKNWRSVTTVDKVDENGITYQVITGLDLDFDPLLKPLPKEITNLTYLEELHLETNPSLEIPVELFSNKNLKKLILNDLKLPDELFDLPKLESLTLKRCEINIQKYSLLQKLTNLKYLNVTHMNLGNSYFDISNLVNMESLTFTNNSLIKIPSSVYDLQNLKSLSIIQNQINTIPEEIKNLTNLTRLDLKSNKIKNVPSFLGELNTLDYIDLFSNEIDEFNVDFSNLVNLTYLNLSHNNLNDISTSILDLPILKTLGINDNLFTFKKLEPFISFRENYLLYYKNAGTYSEELIIDKNNIDNITTLSIPSHIENNSYEWYRNNVKIEGETNHSLSFSYNDNIDSEFYCKVTNSDWTEIFTRTVRYTEEGEMINLTFDNIPSNTPEEHEIEAIITLSDGSEIHYPLSFNETINKYKLSLPKSLGEIQFYFAFKLINQFHEINGDNEKISRSLNLSAINDSIQIDDIIAWNSIYDESSCENSVTLEENVNYSQAKQGWFKFKSDYRAKIKINNLNYENNNRSLEFRLFKDSCAYDTKSTKTIFYNSTTDFLEPNTEYYIYLGPYLKDGRSIIFDVNFEISYFTTYIIPSLPEDTNEDFDIRVYNSDITFESLEYTHATLEKHSDSYSISLPRNYGPLDFTFFAHKNEAFFETDQLNEKVVRSINTVEDDPINILNPISFWNLTPNSRNDCSNAEILNKNGDYIVSAIYYYYTYTATEDNTEIIINSTDTERLNDNILSVRKSCDNESDTIIDVRRSSIYYKDILDKDETIYLRWNTNRNNYFAFQWNFKAIQLKKLIVKNIPENTPKDKVIYAVGNMNQYDYSNTDYPLLFNEETNHYELIFPADIKNLDFQFVIYKSKEYVEVNSEFEVIQRNITIQDEEIEVIIPDIIYWKNIPIFNSTCDESIVLTKPDTILSATSPSWFKYTADIDQVISLKTKDLKDEPLNIFIYKNCNSNNSIVQNNPSSSNDSLLNYRMITGESIMIKLNLDEEKDEPFIWVFDTLHVQHQTLDSLQNLITTTGEYSIFDFVTDQESQIEMEIVGGDAYIENSKLFIENSGDLKVQLKAEGNDYYFDLDSLIILSTDKLYQTFSNDFLVNNFNTTGKHHIGEYTTEENLLLSFEAKSNNVEVNNDSLFISKFGQTMVKIFNEGSGMYHSFDSTITFEVNRLSIEGFYTDFFDNINTTGSYELPEFITDEGVKLHVTFDSDNITFTDSIMNIFEQGEYTVKLYTDQTDFNEAYEATFTFEITNSIPTSIEKDLSNRIIIYPNPSSSKINISLPNIQGDFQIEVLSISGKIIKTKNIIGKTNYSFDLSNYKTGTYLIKIKSSDGIGIKRLIVK